MYETDVRRSHEMQTLCGLMLHNLRLLLTCYVLDLLSQAQAFFALLACCICCFSVHSGTPYGRERQQLTLDVATAYTSCFDEQNFMCRDLISLIFHRCWCTDLNLDTSAFILQVKYLKYASETACSIRSTSSLTWVPRALPSSPLNDKEIDRRIGKAAVAMAKLS